MDKSENTHTYIDDLNTQAIKENLESINPEQSKFVQQVINDVAENNAFDTVSIYQLKDEYEEYLFESLERLEKNGKEPLRIDAYNMVYTDGLEPYQAIATETTLENVWERFNIHRPSDYTGHSLSISDVVALKEQGIETAYFVDSIGFKELPHFFVTRL